MSVPFIDVTAAVVWMVVRSSVLLGAAGAAHLLMRGRTSAATRHLVWTLTVLALLALPLISMVVPRWQVNLPLAHVGDDARMYQRTSETARVTSAAVAASTALPTITLLTPSAASADASSPKYCGGQRFAPPYAAPGASATSGARPSQPAPASTRDAASRASGGTRTRGSTGPFANPRARTSC